MKAAVLAFLAFAALAARAQPPGANQGLPPSAKATGLAPQQVQVLAVEQIQSQYNWSSTDTLTFLVNTECLEAIFDSYGAWGVSMNPELLAGAPPAIGGKKANLSSGIRAWVEEVAHNEIGHVRILREALGAAALPCPQVDVDAAFQEFFRRALGNPQLAWDPYADDLHFVLSMFALEEVGATGDQGVTLINAYNVAKGLGNLTQVAIPGGLAGSAYAQSSADRFILWERRGESVVGTGLTVEQVFAKLSALRQELTGEVQVDQPLIYNSGINVVQNDGNGVTMARTPQQVLNILTLGQGGKGGFFPNGVNGKINTTTPLNPQVPAELLAAANALPVVVTSDFNATNPLQPAEAPSPPVAATGGGRRLMGQ